MANIENKDKTPQENQGKVKETIQKTKEKVQKLSWWAKLFLFCFFGFIFTILSILIVINTSWGQNKLAEKGIELLNNQFKTTFETENVEINFWGDVVVSGVSAKDHRGMEFFKAKKLIGHSDWLTLIFNSRDLKFHKLGLEELDLKVVTYKGEEQDNFTKFIEKFDSPKDQKKPPFKLASRIEIKDSKISIVNENSGEDGKWLKAEKFNAYVSRLQVIGPDVKLKLNRMSFITERWGKKHFLETLSGDLAITKEKFAFTDLIFNTDQSLLQGDLIFYLDKKTGWKDFNDKVKWEMNLKQGSRLHGYDLSYLVTKWDAHQPYQLAGKMSGILNDFTLKDFSIRANENTIKTPEIRLAKLLKGNFHIRANQLFADLDYPNLRASMPEFIAKRMGKFADDFGKIHYNGLADINKERILAKGKLNTSVGNAQVERFTLSEYSTQSPKYEGIVVLDKFNSTAITKKTEIGKISGNFQVSGRGFDLNTLSLTTKSQISQMELLGKIWQNIRIDGDLIAKKFDGLIQIADTEARGNITGKIDFSTPRLLADIRGNVDYLNLAHLGISSKKSVFKGNIDGRLAMTNLNDLDLDATINSATLWGEKPISIPNGAVKIAMENGNRVIKVDMPNAINGQIYGKFNVGDLGGIFQNVADRFLVGNKTKHYYNGQNFVMDFEVHQSLVDYFAPDVLLPDGVKINGQFIGNQNDWQLNVNAPSLKYIMTKREEISEADKLLAKLNPEYIIRENVTKDSIVSENIDLQLDTRNIEKYWQVSAERVQYQNTLLKNIDISAENQGNQLNIATRLDVGTPEKEKEDKMVAYAANLVQSVNAEGDYVVRFDPTHLKINKFTWQVDTSPELNHSITYRRKEKDFVVQNLRIFSENSELLVNGTFKNAKDFDLDGKLQNMEIAKLYALENPDSPLEIKGIANGTLKVKMNESTLKPEVDVEVEDISLNENRLGNLSIKAENTDQKNIYNVKAKMLTSNLFGQELLALEGTIDNNTKSPTLDLKTQLNDFDISFVQAFVKNIFSNF